MDIIIHNTCKKNKKSVDYSKSVIYGIFCKNKLIKNCYISSTCNLQSAKSTHKTICNNYEHKYYNRYLYQFIRNNGGWDNWEVIWLQDYSCNSKKELKKKEKEIYDTYQVPTLNTNTNIINETKSGFIYRIYCKDKNIKDCYVGYMNNKTLKQLREYILRYSNHSNTYVYKFIRENGGYFNWNIMILKHYTYMDIDKDIERIKTDTRNLYDAFYPYTTLNIQIPNATEEEIKEQAKISRTNYMNNMSQEKKDELQDKRKKKWADNKDDPEFKAKKKEDDKKYRESHKEEIKVKKKIAYENNKQASLARADKSYKKRKEEILAQSRKKVNCPCCSKKMSFGSLKTHLLTTCPNKPNVDDIKELVASVK